MPTATVAQLPIQEVPIAVVGLVSAIVRARPYLHCKDCGKWWRYNPVLTP